MIGTSNNDTQRRGAAVGNMEPQFSPARQELIITLSIRILKT